VPLYEPLCAAVRTALRRCTNRFAPFGELKMSVVSFHFLHKGKNAIIERTVMVGVESMLLSKSMLNCFAIGNIPPKGVSFSDFICTFA